MTIGGIRLVHAAVPPCAQMRDAVCQCAGLAGSRAGDDQQRPSVVAATRCSGSSPLAWTGTTDPRQQFETGLTDIKIFYDTSQTGHLTLRERH